MIPMVGGEKSGCYSTVEANNDALYRIHKAYVNNAIFPIPQEALLAPKEALWPEPWMAMSMVIGFPMAVVIAVKLQ
jgi:hypothetical protein